MDIRRIASPLTPFDEDLIDINCKENEKNKKKEIEIILKRPECNFLFKINFNFQLY